jgi:peptidoglycan-associated lipoprotein
MKFAALSLTLSALCVLGCGSDKKPPTSPTGGTDDVSTAPTKANSNDNEKPDDDPKKSQINISDEIKKACGIADSDAHFAFDSANVRDEDARVLGQLATCFTSGPLKGREMRLIGHTDPRGEPEYNMLLGGRRADNVKEFIFKKGMADGKVATSSRGEMDASGTNDASYQSDRRVDVMLGE